MSSVTDVAGESETKTEWHHGTCSRCGRSPEAVLQVTGYGPLCSDCFNVLLERGDSAVVELVEGESDE